MELFIIRVKFAIYYFLHFNTVRQVAARLRAKSAIHDCLVGGYCLSSTSSGAASCFTAIVLTAADHAYIKLRYKAWGGEAESWMPTITRTGHALAGSPSHSHAIYCTCLRTNTGQYWPVSTGTAQCRRFGRYRLTDVLSWVPIWGCVLYIGLQIFTLW